MSRRKNEIKRKAFPFIIAGAIIAAFLIICSFFYIQPENTGQTIVSQNEGVADSQIASSKYVFGNLTINLPSGWSEVKDNPDIKSFIHSASNSALYIDKFEYAPEVNILLSQPETFIPQDTVLTDYNTNKHNEGTLFYEAQSNAGTYYCGKKYLWDKDEIYVITANINSVYYERLAESMDYILNTAVFNGINPIDDDIYLGWDTSYRCQYGMPLGWEEDNGIYRKDDNSLSITILNKDFKTYNNMEFQNDFPSNDTIYTSLKEKDDFMIAEGSINAGGGKSTVYLVPVSVNDNNYIIGFIWRYTDDNVKGLAEKCIKEFKVFPLREETVEETSETIKDETTESNTNNSSTTVTETTGNNIDQ